MHTLRSGAGGDGGVTQCDRCRRRALGAQRAGLAGRHKTPGCAPSAWAGGQRPGWLGWAGPVGLWRVPPHLTRDTLLLKCRRLSGSASIVSSMQGGRPACGVAAPLGDAIPGRWGRHPGLPGPRGGSRAGCTPPSWARVAVAHTRTMSRAARAPPCTPLPAGDGPALGQARRAPRSAGDRQRGRCAVHVKSAQMGPPRPSAGTPHLLDVSHAACRGLRCTPPPKQRALGLVAHRHARSSLAVLCCTPALAPRHPGPA